MNLFLDIISHSLSLSAVLYIFHSILPSLEGKFVLDVGSRLGPVLYGVIIPFSSSKRSTVKRCMLLLGNLSFRHMY